MARREREAAGVHEPAGRARASGERLESRGDERGEAFGEDERQEREPAPRNHQRGTDDADRDEAAREAAEPVERESDVGERTRPDVEHRLRPAAVDPQGPRGHECRRDDDQGDQSRTGPGCPNPTASEHQPRTTSTEHGAS